MKVWYADCDGDGIAALDSQIQMSCSAPSAPPTKCSGGKWTDTAPITGAGDCDDTRADVHPGAPEICDGVDNDCNNRIDEAGLTTFYRDVDGDGHGDPRTAMTTCMPPAGYVTSNDDCDDTRSDVHPGHVEACDGVDNNCNGQVDEGVQQVFYRDADGDGHGNPAATTTACSAPTGYVASNDDCNDARNDVFPGHPEACDGLDNNCNGQIDEGVLSTFYRDLDGDGFGDRTMTTAACTRPAGYVTNSTDCDDSRTTVHPGAPELCFNGLDDNCSGQQDEAAECSIACDWTGARWLSHGWDGGNAFQTGAWATCTNGQLSYMQYVLHDPPGTSGLAIAIPLGLSDNVVGCNWGAGNRWASEGRDGGAAFANGIDATCDGTRVTTLHAGPATGLVGPTTSGQLGCNWTGAIWLTHGADGNCAFFTGNSVTCSNNRITNIQFVENSSCPRERE